MKEEKRERAEIDQSNDRGPFDIIGDIHGCYEELVELLGRLGYEVQGSREEPRVRTPAGRRALFLGDLVDRGPDSPAVLRLAMSMVATDKALCILGNHDEKFLRKLEGRDVKIAFGLAETLEQFEREAPEFHRQVESFLSGLAHHFVLDGGRLIVAHAGLAQRLHGKDTAKARAYCLYGETTGEFDESGHPVRGDWAAQYEGEARVVFGHTRVPAASWRNRTLCLDTGCVFGGSLTALRYPELELVSVPALKVYYSKPA